MKYVYPLLSELDFERTAPRFECPVFIVNSRHDLSCGPQKNWARRNTRGVRRAVPNHGRVKVFVIVLHQLSDGFLWASNAEVMLHPGPARAP